MTSLGSTVVVVGAGVTGLLLARSLTRVGVPVMVIESEPRVFAGATTHNEGWLHHGTYHAVSIPDESAAISVAQRCMYGARKIKEIAPEALEEPLRPSYAFTTQSNVSKILNRWRASGVSFEGVPPSKARATIPQLRTEDITGLYRVADRAIDTRVLGAVLVTELRRAGVPIVLSAVVSRTAGTSLRIESPARTFYVEPRLVVLTTGSSTKTVATSLGLPAPPIRLWRSHLLVVPRLTANPVFSLDPDQPAIMNHGHSAIVGLNEDAEIVAAPTYSPDQDQVDHLLSRLNQRVEAQVSMLDVLPVACTKVDLEFTKNQSRSLAPVAVKLADGYCTILPGKLTEAPYVVDQALVQLLDYIEYTWATHRPCDTTFDSADQRSRWKDEIWKN